MIPVSSMKTPDMCKHGPVVGYLLEA